jgi:hypothetical protein
VTRLTARPAGGYAPRVRAPVLAALVLLAGCRVVVLGDSNSCEWPKSGCVGDVRNSLWPLYITQRADWPGWMVTNRALPNLPAGSYAGAVLGNGEPADGAWHLERLIREDLGNACQPIAGRWVVRRKLVIALGSNDVVKPGVSGAAAGAAVLALYDRARQVPCVDVYVATIPQRLDASAGSVDAANGVIRAHVAAGRIIPFGDEPLSDLDGTVHMTDAAQHRRGDLAFAVLFPPTSRAIGLPDLRPQ